MNSHFIVVRPSQSQIRPHNYAGFLLKSPFVPQPARMQICLSSPARSKPFPPPLSARLPIQSLLGLFQSSAGGLHLPLLFHEGHFRSDGPSLSASVACLWSWALIFYMVRPAFSPAGLPENERGEERPLALAIPRSYDEWWKDVAEGRRGVIITQRNPERHQSSAGGGETSPGSQVRDGLRGKT